MFGARFDEEQELGASVAVTLHGESVVDLWTVTPIDQATWQRDTTINVWSTTKTMTAICLLVLADQGQVDLDGPVGTYWPELAARGKERISVPQIVGHTAGLPGWDPPISHGAFYDWDHVTDALAAQAPLVGAGNCVRLPFHAGGDPRRWRDGHPRACFWSGFGGSIAMIDVDAQVSVAYVMNRMAGGVAGDLRGVMLVLAAYECLAEL